MSPLNAGAARSVLLTSRPKVFTVDKDQYFENVTLLLHMDGANGSTTFTDSSLLGITATPQNGASIITTANSRSNGAAGDFTSTSVKQSLDFSGTNITNVANFGTGDFTIEMTQYSTNEDVNRALLSVGSYSTTNAGFYFYIQANFPVVIFSGVTYTANNGAIFANTLNHIAFTRKNGVLKSWVNGVLNFSANVADNINPSGSSSGGALITLSNMSFHNSSRSILDEVRITKGIARYDAPFTPPTGAFPDSGYVNFNVDSYFSSVSLLLHMDGSNNSTTFTDSSSAARSVTANGDAKISTAQSKFGGASGLFDGNGDYLSIASNSAFNFGTGDFTVEAWVRLASTTGDWFIASASGSGGLFFGYTSSVGNKGWGFGRAAVAWDFTSGSTASAGTWYHVAIARSGTSMRLFVNGTQAGATATNSTSYDISTTSLNIGSQGANYYLNGNIDDLRITKGVARYTYNFIPPLYAFPNS